MNFPLAAELFSKTTAGGVMTYTAMGLLPSEAMHTGKFCELINIFFLPRSMAQYSMKVLLQMIFRLPSLLQALNSSFGTRF